MGKRIPRTANGDILFPLNRWVSEVMRESHHLSIDASDYVRRSSIVLGDVTTDAATSWRPKHYWCAWCDPLSFCSHRCRRCSSRYWRRRVPAAAATTTTLVFAHHQTETCTRWIAWEIVKLSTREAAVPEASYTGYGRGAESDLSPQGRLIGIVTQCRHAENWRR